MRDDLVEIIRKPQRRWDFPQVQIATNGVRIAKEPGLAQQLKDPGLNTVYLHFDGVSPQDQPVPENP